MKNNIPIVLSIAGSDSGGGAGIQADIKTLNTMKVFAVTAITCITAQNTKKIRKISKVSPNLVEEQILSVKEDFKISAVKIGMLYDKEIMLKVSKCIKLLKDIPIIVDPVMISKSGDYLLKPSAINFFKKEILPKAWLVTPNLHEALNLSGMQVIEDEKDIKNCCIKLNKFGAENILIKGGHLKHTKEAVDYLFHNNKIYKFTSSRYNTKNTHGTGCTLSAAISGNIAKGMHLIKAIKEAKKFVDKAIKNSLKIGSGHGPLNHFP
jgi:hydroxymethylpyrimidine/phosphomethylpyrimidine kinase